jgi:cytochrome d ubiquinol oxidase subunit I
MHLDPVQLSRVQFGLTIMFHYLFPPLTIGMGVVLVYLEAMFLIRREPVYEIAARFWTQLYAVTFAIGVATGIVMEFEFGTNWAAYSRFVGDVFGSALAAEGIFAFFLESGFLAVLIFGWEKVGPVFHFFATLMVSLGSIFSALWIIVANSWQQTPAGHHIVQMIRDGRPWFIDGKPVMRAEVIDFWALVFNPSTTTRLVHTLIGAFILGAFFIMSISAYYLLRRRHEDFARRSFTGALLFATVFSCAQLLSGDRNAKMVAANQPAKLAAFEGLYQTGPAALSLAGIPDDAQQKLNYKIASPGLLSYLVAGDSHAPVIGLDRFPQADRPPVGASFWTYHLMVALGMYFIGLTLLASFLRWRRTLFQRRWLMWVFVFSVVGAMAANELGWAAAEVGRQPYVVYPRPVLDQAGRFTFDDQGMLRSHREEALRTADGVSEAMTGGQVLGSIIMFSVVYLLLFAVWIYVLNDKIHKGPQPFQITNRTMRHAFAAVAAERIDHAGSLTDSSDDSIPNEEVL